MAAASAIGQRCAAAGAIQAAALSGLSESSLRDRAPGNAALAEYPRWPLATPAGLAQQLHAVALCTAHRAARMPVMRRPVMCANSRLDFGVTPACSRSPYPSGRLQTSATACACYQEVAQPTRTIPTSCTSSYQQLNLNAGLLQHSLYDDLGYARAQSTRHVDREPPSLFRAGRTCVVGCGCRSDASTPS